MCGIAGAIGFVDDTTIDAVRRATDAQVHRGPDGSGFWSTRDDAGIGAAFGHRRLAVIDLSDRGSQPMADPVSGCVISYNGEVYNFRGLRSELEDRGCTFSSQTDTEVLLKAYAEWGPGCVDRLHGMFAFAIWDPRQRSVFLARDRLGLKPLYLADVRRPDGTETVFFASELRALLAADFIERRIDNVALATYLWNGFLAGPHTIARDVSLLGSGTTLTIRAENVARKDAVRYWRPPVPELAADQGEAVERLEERLQEAVSERLVSDVPLGLFLSGGTDSSAVAALAMRALPGRLRTFNVAFDEAAYDESRYASTVAGLLGTDHHEVRLTGAEFRAHLDEALDCLDQPTFDALNSYFVSRAVREAGLTVALAGTGGDELFGGYSSFLDVPRARRWASVAAFVPRALRRVAARSLTRLRTGAPGAVPPQVRWGKLEDMFETRGDMLAGYQCASALFTRDFHKELAIAGTPPGMQHGLPVELAEQLIQDTAGMTELERLSTFELALFLRERLLRDTDAASMAVSLEVRVPLIDHTVIEALSSLPAERRFLPVFKKRLLRDAALADLDPALFERQKHGFDLPLDVWCRQELRGDMQETLSDEDLCLRVGLRPQAVRKLWQAFQADAPGIYWNRVWAIYILLWWCRRYGFSV